MIRVMAVVYALKCSTFNHSCAFLIGNITFSAELANFDRPSALCIFDKWSNYLINLPVDHAGNVDFDAHLLVHFIDALEADNIHPVIPPNRSYGVEGGFIFMDDVFVVGDMDPMCTSHMHWDRMGSFPLWISLSPQMMWIIPMATLRSWRKLPFLVDPFQIALTTMPSSWSMEGHFHIQD